jgi:hypothetical protein
VSYALRTDGEYGCRAVKDATECAENEAWSEVFVPYVAPEPTIDELAAAIEAEYEAKIAVYEKLVARATLADGVNLDTKIAEFQSKYSELTNQMNAELEALFSE